MRQLFLVLAAALPVLAAASTTFSQGPGPQEDQDPLDRARLDHVPIVAEGGVRATIDIILVQRGNQLLAINAERGVEQISQNRLGLNRVPVVGHLFAPRFSQRDFAPQYEVGAAYLADDTLLIRLDEDQAQNFFTDVVVINQMHSYTLQGPMTERYSGAAPPPLPASPELIGRAYAGEENKLLVLIEPSVITWSIF